MGARKISCRQAHARDRCVAFGDVGHGERDVLLVCDGGEVQLGTKERAVVPEIHAGLPVLLEILLNRATYLGVDV